MCFSKSLLITKEFGGHRRTFKRHRCSRVAMLPSRQAAWTLSYFYENRGFGTGKSGHRCPVKSERFQLKHLLSKASRLKLKLLLETEIFIKETNLTDDHLVLNHSTSERVIIEPKRP